MRYARGYTGPMLPGPRPRDEVTTMPVKPGRGQTGGPKPYTGPARPVPGMGPADTTATTMPDSVGYKKGGKVSASRRGDGVAQRGKTKGRMI